MKSLIVACFALAAAYLPLQAQAAPVVANTHYSFSFTGAGSAFGNGSSIVTCTNPTCIAAPDAPWEITLASNATLTVVDLFVTGDVFELFSNNVSLGTTSTPGTGPTNCGSNFTCALGSAAYSSGTFALSAGFHSITGVQTAGISGGGAFVIELAAVPVPASFLLLGAGIGALSFARRRKTV